VTNVTRFNGPALRVRVLTDGAGRFAFATRFSWPMPRGGTVCGKAALTDRALGTAALVNRVLGTAALEDCS
jgi:hypothetical protein